VKWVAVEGGPLGILLSILLGLGVARRSISVTMPGRRPFLSWDSTGQAVSSGKLTCADEQAECRKGKARLEAPALDTIPLGPAGIGSRFDWALPKVQAAYRR
jgi:hypothetical protein